MKRSGLFRTRVPFYLVDSFDPRSMWTPSSASYSPPGEVLVLDAGVLFRLGTSFYAHIVDEAHVDEDWFWSAIVEEIL